MSRVLFALVLVTLVLIPSEAHLARSPDIIRKTVTYRGETAGAFASLLELPAQPAAVSFELSQADEHRALPERRAMLSPSGVTPYGLAWRTSTQIRETVTWRDGVLTLDGYVADLATSSFGAGRRQFTFSSPGISRHEVDQLSGWKPVFAKLIVLPAKQLNATSDERRIEIVLSGGEGIEAVLYRIDTFDANNQPIEKYTVVIGFGPTLPVTPPTEKRSRRC